MSLVDLRTDSPAGPATEIPPRVPRRDLRLGRLRIDPRTRGVAKLFDGRPWPWMLFAVDLAALTAGVAVAIAWPGENVALSDAKALALLPIVATILLSIRGMYQRRLRLAVIDTFAPVAGALSTAAMAVALFDIYIGPSSLQPAVYVHAWGVSLALVCVGRTAMLLAHRRLRVRGRVGSRALIVGAGHVGARIARRLLETPEYGLRPIGFIDDDPLQIGEDVAGVGVLGAPADLEQIARLSKADHVVLAFSTHPDVELVDLVRRCDVAGLEVLLVPRLFDSLNQRASYEALGGLPLQRLRSVSPRGWRFTLKHAIDRVVAGTMLFLLSPVMVLIAIAIKIESRGPVLFRQQRVGRDGKRFDLLKFRSMALVDDGEPFQLARGAAPGGIEGLDRRTLVGRVLRRCSLDELPQLINVVRGQMSLVGPRPERPEFVDLFMANIDRYGDRHRVRSGMTGWAQVHGLRGQTSLADRVEWDNYYIEHWSLGLDLKIFALTLVAVFRAAE